jgi:hypothetical protein
MEYNVAYDLSKQVKDIDQNYLDEKMEDARAVSQEARRKILAAKQQDRLNHQVAIQNLKSSLYGF